MVSTAGRGGVHQYAWLLTAALSDLEVATMLVAPRDSESLAGPVPRIRPIAAGRGPLVYPRQAARLLQLSREVDIVHFQAPLWSLLDPWGLVSALRGAGTRVTATLHNVLPHRRRPYHLRAYRRLYAQLDGIAVHSAAHLHALTAMGARPRRSVTVPFGDLGCALGDATAAALPTAVAGDERRTVLVAGQIRPDKGVADLIPAMQGTTGRWRLLLAGEPLEPVERYVRLAAEHSVDLVAPPELTRYLERAQMAACFAVADVVALPYRRGWNSGVLSLAAHWGRPAVVTTAAASPEDLARVPAAAVVPPADPASLRSALEAAIAGRVAPPSRFPPWDVVARAYAPLWTP
jgi:glycosyltransferase involved in cell wall biosynthesis